jgi:hypothetical protein
MRVLASVCAVCVAVFLSGCDSGGDHHHSNGPTDEQLKAREAAAANTMQDFLYSYLDGDTGLPNAAYFIPAFNLDGWDRSEYLSRFWDADAAEDAGDGKVRLLYGTASDGEYYDVQVTKSTSPTNLSLPVVVELGLAGGTIAGDAPLSSYSALWNFFMLENPDASFSVTAQAPTWEYEVLTAPPEPFNFVVNEVMLNGTTIYKTEGQYNEPAFYVTKIQTAAGASFLIDVAVLAVGSESNAFLKTKVTERLFYAGSPAESANLGVGNIAFTQTLMPFWDESPVASGVLAIPAGLAAGWYTLVVSVENENVPVDPDQSYRFAYDSISMPVEVLD